MKTMNVTGFKARCLSQIEEVRQTEEPIGPTKRVVVAVVSPPARKESVDWTPGAFKDMIEVGDIGVDGADLGIRWEALE